MYSAFGLLTANTDFTMPEAARRLAAKFPSYAVTQDANAIVVATDDWEIHLTLNESADVLAESREIAERIGGARDATDIAACVRRVELASDIPDPVMAHFNDYLLAVEVLQSFKGLIAVDPKEPSLL
jgi:voltage-gated potassium channel Kch